MWERIFGSYRLKWLMQCVETDNAMCLCHRVLKTTCLASCEDTDLKHLLDALYRIPGPAMVISEDNIDRFDLVFICQLIRGENNIWFPQTLDLSSSLLAWKVIEVLLSLQRAPNKSGKSFYLYCSTVHSLFELLLNADEADRNSNDKKIILITVTMVITSILRESENISLPNNIPWNVIESKIFPIIRSYHNKLLFGEFNGSQLVELIIKAHSISIIDEIIKRE
jgi:hypothetical protein